MRFIAIALALLLAACSSIPRPGFATRYFGGTIGSTMHDAVVPQTDFTGTPIAKPYTSEFAATPPVQSAPPALVRGIQTTSCTDAARQRALDVRDEGFGSDVQHQVFDKALADCRRWQAQPGS
jgi:hypothetical protein